MIRIGIYGYGNLGKGVECAIYQNDDIELFGIFTRRNAQNIKTLTNAKVFSASDLLSYKKDFDVLVICGGSATDLPEMTPKLASDFTVVDSFDTHAKIPEYYDSVNQAAITGKHTAIISGGWDPGLFSLARIYGEAVLPHGKTYTFWGRGVSQGHSDAIRRIPGVIDARQYTIPVVESVNKVKNGEQPDLNTCEKHTRECFVVTEDNADKSLIESTIKSMPNYFADYITTVHFVSEEELLKNHSKLPHGGMVIRSGTTGLNNENTEIIEYNLKLDSNPEFTGSVLVALARAAVKMEQNGEYGCKTILDIPPAFLSQYSPEELRKNLL